MTQYELQYQGQAIRFSKGVQTFGYNMIGNTKDFYQNVLFKGFDIVSCDNEYLYINRVSNDKTKIIIDIDFSYIKRGKYGYLVKLTDTVGFYVKKWQMQYNSRNYHYSIVIDKKYFKLVQYKQSNKHNDKTNHLNFDYLLKIAKGQQIAKWKKRK